MENNVNIHVPITITYPALEGVLRAKMVGEYIPRIDKGSNEAAYAQILNVSIAGNSVGAYDLALKIKIRILRTVLKRDNIDLFVQASLGYDQAGQQLYIKRFKVDSRTQSGFFNTALEVLANNVAYEKILQKAKVNLKDIIAKEKEKVNALLANGLEPVKGVFVKGIIDEISVPDMVAHSDSLALSLILHANVEAEITDLTSLLAAKKD